MGMVAGAEFLFDFRRVRKDIWKSCTGMDDDDAHFHCNYKAFVLGVLCFPRSIPVILVPDFCLTCVGRVTDTRDPQCEAMP